MNGRGWQRMALVVAVCGFVGALAGIAGSAAAPSKDKATAAAKAKAIAKAQKKAFRKQFRRGFGPGPVFGPGRPGGPVHAELVVPKADGSGFLTVTEDGGTLISVDDHTLHVKEAVDKNVYKDDAAVTVGSDVKVIRNHKDATLSDLKAGDHVHVITGAPKGDIVIAEDDAFAAQEQKEHRTFGEHDHGMRPGGPPPGGPPAGFGFGAGGPPLGAPGDDPGESGSNQNGSDSGSSSGSSSNNS